MIARRALDQLRERMSCRTAYVNGWRHHEQTDILYQIVNEIPDVVAHRQATSRGQLLDHLGHESKHRYVVLDEADQLSDKAVLYDLVETDGLSLILIANNEADLFAGVDDRLESRLVVGKRIQCDARLQS